MAGDLAQPHPTHGASALGCISPSSSELSPDSPDRELLCMHQQLPQLPLPETVPWTVSAGTKGCRFPPPRDQNTSARRMQTQRASCSASSDLQGLQRPPGSPKPASPHTSAPQSWLLPHQPPPGSRRCELSLILCSCTATCCKGPSSWVAREVFKGFRRWRVRVGAPLSCLVGHAVLAPTLCHLPSPSPWQAFAFHLSPSEGQTGQGRLGWS